MSERSTGHIAALDGLRFLAAAVVLIGHCFNVFAWPPEVARAVREGPLTVLVNGYGAVHLFFVLSGFCLAGSAARSSRGPELAQFYVRRVLRIHPPYMAALAVAWLASFAYDTSRGGDVLSDYIVERAAVHLPLRELLPYFLYPSAASMQLGPAWTLFVELNFSFLLPVMVWLARRTHWSLLVAVSGLPLLDGGALPGFLDYGIHFALGIALYEERDALARLLAGRSPVWTAAALAAGLFVFAAPHVFGLVYAPGFAFAPEGLLVSGLGGAMLLSCALFFPGVGAALSARPLVRGGRISYSFYLLHFPVMILSARFLEGPIGLGSMVVFTSAVFALTTAAAAGGFAWVERPAIRLGNALCRALARRADVRAQVSRLAA